MIPGGTPTASFTSYEIGSGKNASFSTNFPGHLQVITSATSSGNTEAQALFTRFPVTLATNGDYIELDVTFVDQTNVLNGLGGNGTGPYIGLYNSGGVAPLAGTLLWNGGLSSSLTTAATGGTRNWVGYDAGMLRGLSAASAWNISGRIVQTTANNLCQELLFGAQTVGGVNANPAVFPFPTNLFVGSNYTAQLKITLSTPTTLTVSNALYIGSDTTGQSVWTNVANNTGANFLTTNFDGLAVGARPGGGGMWTNDFTSIKVIAEPGGPGGGPTFCDDQR